MANPVVVSLKLIAGVGNGIAQAQTPAGAGALTLNGSLVSGGVATLDVARRIVIASTANDATVKFTVTGTDRYGNPLTAVVTGLNANSAYTAVDFLTVTSVTSSAATAGLITSGTNGVASTQWFVDNIQITPFMVAVAVSLTGAVTYSIEHTYDDPNGQQNGTIEPASNVPPLVWADPTLNNVSVNGETQIGYPVFAHRMTIYSGTGTAQMQSIQAGIAN